VPIDERAFVVIGDVIKSRERPRASTAWLRALAVDLDRSGPEGPLASYGFTQGDEFQGLLPLEADPVRVVTLASLHEDALPMRWVIVAGAVEPGDGPATERTGPAFLVARALLDEARSRRDRLLVSVGVPREDELLDAVAPLLADLLGDLTDRQRTIARLMLIDGLRRSEVADALGVSRATISVMAERARIRRIESLIHVVGRLVADGTGMAT
jgi:hypothetical protein